MQLKSIVLLFYGFIVFLSKYKTRFYIFFYSETIHSFIHSRWRDKLQQPDMYEEEKLID